MTSDLTATSAVDADSLARTLRAVLVASGEPDATVVVTPPVTESAAFHAELQHCFGLAQCTALGVVIAFETGHECLARVELPEQWGLGTAYPASSAEKAPLKGVTMFLASCEWRPDSQPLAGPDLQPLAVCASDKLTLPDLTKRGWLYGLNYQAQLNTDSFPLLPKAATDLRLLGALKDDEHGDATLHLSGQIDGGSSPLESIEQLWASSESGRHSALSADLQAAGLSDSIRLAPLIDDCLKRLKAFTAKQLDLFASVWPDASAPKGRLQLTGAMPALITSAPEVPVALWWPLDTKQLFLRNQAPIALAPMAFRPSNTASGAGSALDEVERLLASVVIREILIVLSPEPIGLDRLWITLGSNPAAARNQPGNAAADDFTVTDVSVRLEIAPKPRVRIHLELQLFASAHIELEGMLPDLIFSGSLKPHDEIKIDALLQKLKLGSLDGSGLGIDDLALEVNLGQQRNYALHLDVASEWPLALGGSELVALKRVGIDLEHSENGLSALIEGVWSIPRPADEDLGSGGKTAAEGSGGPVIATTFDVRLSASHDGSDWMIGAESVGSTDLPIGHLIKQLADRLRSEHEPEWHCPQALELLRAKNLRAIIERHAEGTDLDLHCETEWTFRGGRAAALALSIRKDGSGLMFDGLLTIGDSRFEVRFAESDAASPVLAAFYMHERTADASLADLFGAIIPDEHIVAALREVRVDLQEALIAATGSKYLVAFLVNAHASVSNLPLVGAELPGDFSIGFDNVYVLIASEQFTKDDRQALEKLLPSKVQILAAITAARGAERPIEEGFDVSAQLTYGDVKQPLHTSSAEQSQQGGGATTPSAPAIATGPSTSASTAGANPNPPAKTDTTAPTWIAVQRSFGPLHLERIGVQLSGQEAVLALDAALSIAGLTVSFDALTLRTPLGPFAPKFSLRGLGIDFRNSAVDIGGAFVARGEDSYGGAAVIKFKELAISALGLYEEIDGHCSMCIYAALDYPIGGPAFFFVTGLAAAFGYSRKLNPPGIEEVAKFPLVSFAQRAAGTHPDLETDLRDLSRAIVPAIGECFLGIGVRFTSFKIANSFALLTCSFGSHTEFNLLGISNVIAPPGVETSPAASIELALKGSFLPDAGFLGIQAQLTPGSYLLSDSCHLSGGFAFFSWFGASEHKGDFVLSVGGYHPAFAKPAHYPDVPRLGINWKVHDSPLAVKGQAYFALTPDALMVGGALEANWTSDSLRAWFKFAADMLLEWQPYHYRASASVEIGLEVTFEFFGTHHLSVEVGAQLSVWGPEFSGKAIINLTVISVQVAFGPTATDTVQRVVWQHFRSFLPEQVCSIALAGGVAIANHAPEHSGELPSVDPYHLVVIIDSALPVHEAVRCESDPRLASATEHEIPDKQPYTPFILRPMGLHSDKFLSKQRICVLRRHPANTGSEDDVSADFHFAPVTKHVPRALWGEDAKGDTHDDSAIVKDVLTGWRLTPSAPTYGPHLDVTLGPDSIDFTNIWAAPLQYNAAEDDLLQAREVPS